MMTVALGSSDITEMRLWFDRTVAAQLDHNYAWYLMRWGLRPRWFGDKESLLAFGVTSLKTHRFDTDVPRKFFDAVDDLSSEEKTRRGEYLFSRPNIWPIYRKCMRVTLRTKKAHPSNAVGAAPMSPLRISPAKTISHVNSLSSFIGTPFATVIVSVSDGWSGNQVTQTVKLDPNRNTFTFRLSDRKVTASFNGQEVFHDVPLPTKNHSLPRIMLVGLGAYNDINDTVIRYRNVDLRRVHPSAKSNVTKKDDKD